MKLLVTETTGKEIIMPGIGEMRNSRLTGAVDGLRFLQIKTVHFDLFLKVIDLRTVLGSGRTYIM